MFMESDFIFDKRLEVSTPKHKTLGQNFGRSKAQIRTERGWTFVLYAPQLYVPNITVFECPSHQQQHQRQMRQETEIVGKGTPVSRSTTASPPDKRRKTSIDPRGSATIPKSVDLSHQAQNEEECGWVGNTTWTATRSSYVSYFMFTSEWFLESNPIFCPVWSLWQGKFQVCSTKWLGCWYDHCSMYHVVKDLL